MNYLALGLLVTGKADFQPQTGFRFTAKYRLPIAVMLKSSAKYTHAVRICSLADASSLHLDDPWR